MKHKKLCKVFLEFAKLTLCYKKCVVELGFIPTPFEYFPTH